MSSERVVVARTGCDFAVELEEPLHDLIPMRRVEVVKRVVVVSRARRLFAAQAGQRILVPENQMISEHSYRMVSVGIDFALRVLRHPLRLLSR